MLNRLAVRWCVVQALTGKTFAEGRVADSAIIPVEAKAAGESAPYIAVYTDDQGADGLTVTIEIGVTAAMTTADEDGQPVLVVGVPPTDAGIEMTLDLIERQVHDALSDDGNPWSQLFRLAFRQAPAVESLRGASAKEGERFAGRQIRLIGSALADPPFGQIPSEGSFWEKFLDQVEASSELGGHRALLESVLGIVTRQPSILGLLLTFDSATVSGANAQQLLQRALAATAGEVGALGLETRFGETISAPETALE